MLKIYFYAKDRYEAKNQLLINKRRSVGLKHNDSKAFIDYWNDMNAIYEKIKEYNLNKKQKIWMIFDDMIDDMLSNKKLQQIVTLFIRGRK